MSCGRQIVIVVDARIDIVAVIATSSGLSTSKPERSGSGLRRAGTGTPFGALPHHLTRGAGDSSGWVGSNCTITLSPRFALDVRGEVARVLVIEQAVRKLSSRCGCGVHDEVQRAADRPAGIGRALGRRPEFERAGRAPPPSNREQETAAVIAR